MSWGSKVEVYCANLDGIDDSRWVDLLDACRIYNGDSEGQESDSEDNRNAANLSLLDNNRATVFNFCSPMKDRV